MTNAGGWHPTGVFGPVATAAACARLLKLNAAQTAEAIGISTSLASGLAVNYGTMTKPLHCGNAARNGVMAAMLAAKGFTSHAAALEGNNSFFTSFGRGLKTNFEPFKDLGSRWDLSTIGYSLKFYPCGGRGHTAIEAALILRDKVASRLDEITNIHCLMSPSSAKRVNTEYPTTVEAAKFSAAYVLAYSLLYGAPKIKAFTEEALKDPRVRALAGRVTAGPDPKLDAGFIENPTYVKITMKDGQSFDHRREFATGSKQVPFTAAQIEEKFMDCATQTLSADTGKKLFAFVSTINDRPSFGDFWPLIRKA
jgi:2-methylcitrate dehydratase PrpD